MAPLVPPVPALTEPAEGDPRPIAGGEGEAAELRWQCRCCGTKTRAKDLMGASTLLWRRRRPLSSWLFGRP